MLEAHELVHVVGLRREHDDGNIRKLPNLGTGGKPVHIGHHHVQHHQVGILLPDGLDGFQPVAAGDDFIALILKIEAGALDQQRLIVHNQYFHLNLLL